MLGLTGCGLVYTPTGQVLTNYAQDEVVPHALASDDLYLTACGTGMGLDDLIGSFGRVTDHPSLILLNTGTLAGLCSAGRAQQASLRYERALRAGDTARARDARTRAQRLYRRTAQRRHRVYKETVRAFGKLGDGQCPDLDTETRQAEFLVGLLTSVQALLNDIRASGSVDVPQDVAARVGRASSCLANDKWWGVPDALQAVVWLSVPGTAPEDAVPWQQLESAADRGESQGMSLAPVLYAIAAYGRSDKQRQKQGIRQVARIHEEGEGPKDYRILARVAYHEAQFLSDRIWTRATGHRTPFRKLGEFPGDPEEQSGGDFDAGKLLE